METLIIIVCIVFGILQICLFFKLWGMTNDVNSIRRIVEYNNVPKEEFNDYDKSNQGDIVIKDTKFQIGDLVILKATGRQMRVKEVMEDGKYGCYINNGSVHVGNFSEDEIKLF